MIVNTKELSDFFDVTPRAVNKWSAKGCPKSGRGKWDLKTVHAWWLDNIYASKADDSDESLQEAKRRYWSAKAENEEIKRDESKGLLVKVKDIVLMWSGRVAEIKNGLMALPMRLPPLLEGKPQIEMRQIVEDEVWKLLDNYCRVGRFCPAKVRKTALNRRAKKKK